MFGITDPDEMTSDERSREMARILARGFLRFRKKDPLLGDSVAKSEGKKPVTSSISNGCAVDKSSS